MTLQELYYEIGGDYDQAMRVLRMEKLIDKHIRKMRTNSVVEGLVYAGESMEPAQIFEAAHAMKGVCANLGLVGLAGMASEIAEEFRPGNSRRLTDDEVKLRIKKIGEAYKRTADRIRRYEEG
ncbi:Hpt domain-containing protein [Ruminococcus albus]|uniref:HPt (Histidine-containing phosphotransfer) domain-containing protein n=1 Tax=Ruminococcus albus TaxID=1264 RepID=A0A1H7NNG8_RUMAL|nr:Hpt domain-containing protein [Ruminococcus albus]SEL24874.1 HPt (histidine-containing phosphotransfer) domain-containing protein [Ruminococcus albus]